MRPQHLRELGIDDHGYLWTFCVDLLFDAQYVRQTLVHYGLIQLLLLFLTASQLVASFNELRFRLFVYSRVVEHDRELAARVVQWLRDEDGTCSQA